MRDVLPEKLEAGRLTSGPMASRPDWGAYGAFFVQGPCGEELKIIASGADPDDKDSAGWEHVSVSTRRRPPNWQEMCFVKDLFWSEEECVIQFHPPKSEYVNNHPHCLHLWRPVDGHVRRPPSILVGVKDKGILTEVSARELRREMGL
jgi:hypothetical protein